MITAVMARLMADGGGRAVAEMSGSHEGLLFAEGDHQESRGGIFAIDTSEEKEENASPFPAPARGPRRQRPGSSLYFPPGAPAHPRRRCGAVPVSEDMVAAAVVD